MKDPLSTEMVAPRLKDVLAAILANQAGIMAAMTYIRELPENTRIQLGETHQKTMTLVSALMQASGGHML